MIGRRTPGLQFGPTATPCGFTSYNTASFSDLRPAPIVRGLIQNALDAAVEAGEATSIVRFKVTCISSNDVPDMDGYRKAFRDVVRCQKEPSGELSDAAQQVVDTIERALHDLADDGCWCLSVLDNGIGLDEKRLNALLGDGASFKGPAETGSYGVGHFTSITASNLRYVLYGGVQKSGERIASGCAMLASRNNPQKDCLDAAQGYLVNGFRSGNDGAYDFMSATSIPDILDACLTEIETQWKHGSAVVIPAFNYFGDEQNRHFLWDVIFKITAYNFNAAIQHGRLAVEVDEDDVLEDADKMGVRRLDADTLRGVLEHESEHKRSARKHSFFYGLRPSGQHAYAAYLTLEEGDRDRMTTSAGGVDIRLRQPAPTGNTRVDLYRNGMWITDDISYLKRADFPNRPPFHAVLLLDASTDNEFHRLVRKAEGPMHNELALTRLAKNERRTLEKALQDTAKWIKNRIPEVSTENYSPDDFLVVETGGEGPGGGAKPYAMWGAPVVIRRSGATQPSVATPISPPPGSRSSKREPSKARPRTPRTASDALSFTSTVVPDRKGGHVIVLECTESVAEVLLSLRVDENTDVTCDRIWPDEDVPLRSCRIADESTATGRLTEDRRSIRLSGLSSGSVHRLTVEHAIPDELAETVRAPVFRVELRRLLLTGDDDADDG